MAREIKFRLPWFKNSDNSFSHFTYWGRIDHKGNYSNDCFTSPGQVSSCYHKDDQQFTGLHDCNGKEIYTDSVVKFKYMVSLNHSIDLIGRFFYDDTELRYQIEIYNDENYTVLNYMYNGTMYDFEEIGSIYEHPELLNT